MATLTTGVVLLRWQLLSAVMMFLASTLNIRFRRADYVGLAVISSGLGVVSACWFAMGLLGITMADITAIWHNIESVMIEEMNQTPPQWPMILTCYVEASITEASFLWLADALIIHLKTIYPIVLKTNQNGISSSKSIGGSLDGAAGADCCGRDCAPPLN